LKKDEGQQSVGNGWDEASDFFFSGRRERIFQHNIIRAPKEHSRQLGGVTDAKRETRTIMDIRNTGDFMISIRFDKYDLIPIIHAERIAFNSSQIWNFKNQNISKEQSIQS
jgi:hypothetical protein